MQDKRDARQEDAGDRRDGDDRRDSECRCNVRKEECKTWDFKDMRNCTEDKGFSTGGMQDRKDPGHKR